MSPALARTMARELAKVAKRSADGRIAMVLEGGYDLVALEECLSSAIEGLVNEEELRGPVAPRDHPDVERARAAARRGWGRVL